MTHSFFCFIPDDADSQETHNRNEPIDHEVRPSAAICAAFAAGGHRLGRPETARAVQRVYQQNQREGNHMEGNSRQFEPT